MSNIYTARSKTGIPELGPFCQQIGPYLLAGVQGGALPYARRSFRWKFQFTEFFQLRAGA